MNRIALFAAFALLSTVCGDQCGETLGSGLSDGEEKDILKKHNDYRLMIANGKIDGQPRGVDLKRMKYDDKLAETAKAVSDRCLAKHHIIRDSRWNTIGQNIYATYSKTFSKEKDWNKALEAWFKEHEHYNFGKGSTNKKIVTHYTQIIWAATEFLGCDYKHFHNKTNKNRPYTKLYTCNYGPPGNRKGRDPYKTGNGGCQKLCD